MNTDMKKFLLLALLLCSVSLSAQKGFLPVGGELHIYEEKGKDSKEQTCFLVQCSNGSWIGRMNATTDEFEIAREGYTPGYIIAPLENIKVVNDSTLSFSVTTRKQFQSKVPLYIQNEEEALQYGIPTWIQSGWLAEPTSTRHYEVVFSKAKMVILPNGVNDKYRREFILVK